MIGRDYHPRLVKRRIERQIARAMAIIIGCAALWVLLTALLVGTK